MGIIPGWGLSLNAKIERSVELLRMNEAIAIDHDPAGYYGCFSGGKDSVVIKELANIAKVKCEWNYNCTTIDPPEIYKFIRNQHKDVKWNRPDKHFFCLLAQKGYPTRIARWCCHTLKESSAPGRVKIVGVRWAESFGRRKWEPVHWFDGKRAHGKEDLSCWMVNPILEWTDDDVWKFIRTYKIAYCSLYDEGFKRIGCVGCPMAGPLKIKEEFKRWPNYEKAWRKAFAELWNRRRGSKLTRGKNKGDPWPAIPGVDTPEKLFDWWLTGKGYPKASRTCQLGLW